MVAIIVMRNPGSVVLASEMGCLRMAWKRMRRVTLHSAATRSMLFTFGRTMVSNMPMSIGTSLSDSSELGGTALTPVPSKPHSPTERSECGAIEFLTCTGTGPGTGTGAGAGTGDRYRWHRYVCPWPMVVCVV